MKNRASQFYLLSLLSVLFLFQSCVGKRDAQSAPMASAVVVLPPTLRTLAPLPVRELSPEMKIMRERALASAVKLRGLDFTTDVKMTELTGWEYGTRAREMAELIGGDDLRSLNKLAVAGGMLPADSDLATLAASFAAVSAGATYSPFDKQVLLVSKFKDTALITHEYVHALQDQHFDLLRLLTAKPFDFDRTEAAFALIEGDAINVQRRFESKDGYEKRTLDEIAQIENDRFADYRREVGALFPPLLTESFVFRYRDGARFVEAVRRNKKSGGLDALFSRPPVSSEQVLHPEKYFAGEIPRDVSVKTDGFAAQGWHLGNSSPLGEVGIRGLLMSQLADKDAARCAAGWDGDRAFLFENPNGEQLFVWKTIWESDKDATEFAQGYEEMTQKAHPTAQRINFDSQTLVFKDASMMPVYLRRHDRTVIIVRGNENQINFAASLTAD